MKILGGMGAFLMGMHMLSDSVTKLAHTKLKRMLDKTAKSRFAGVGIGAAVTIIGQSSAFTTVMVVGLVNAGIMTLFQATAIIMGANVGTTLTGWVISLKGFGGVFAFDFTSFFLCLTVVGVFMTMFAKKDKIKSIGNALAALGLVFVGLSFMSDAMSFQEGTAEFAAISGALQADILNGVGGAFLLLLIGIAFTAIVQSSTAVTATVVAMAVGGITIGGGGNAVYFLIIGSNIGTCVTALISSFGASPNAKRAAVIHFMFNLFGALIFTVVLLCWSGFADTILKPLFSGNTAMEIAMFHTLFNVICTFIFLPFVKVFVKIADFLVREKKKETKGEASDVFIAELDDRLLRSPSLALAYLYEETGKIFTFAMGTLNTAFDAFIAKDESVKEKVVAENTGLAEVNRRVVAYLVKLSATALPMEDEKTVSTLHYVLNDIMRIGELADNVTKYTEHYVHDELIFSGEFIEMIEEMYGKIKNLYVLSLATFLYNDFARLQEVDELEDEIDRARKKLVSQHIARLNEGKCQPQNSGVFINLVGNLERAADHITFIAHSIEQSN